MVNSKEHLETWLKQAYNSVLKFSQQLATWSPAQDMDTQMKEVKKVEGGLAESHHTVKQLSEKDINEMAKELGLEEEIVEDKNKEMEE